MLSDLTAIQRKFAASRSDLIFGGKISKLAVTPNSLFFALLENEINLVLVDCSTSAFVDKMFA